MRKKNGSKPKNLNFDFNHFRHTRQLFVQLQELRRPFEDAFLSLFFLTCLSCSFLSQRNVRVWSSICVSSFSRVKKIIPETLFSFVGHQSNYLTRTWKLQQNREKKKTQWKLFSNLMLFVSSFVGRVYSKRITFTSGKENRRKCRNHWNAHLCSCVDLIHLTWPSQYDGTLQCFKTKDISFCFLFFIEANEGEWDETDKARKCLLVCFVVAVDAHRTVDWHSK